MVAKTMIANSDHANAIIYTRFWAYCLSRCPVVLEEAKQGKKPSFYIPYDPLKKSIQLFCPEILEDLTAIFGEEICDADVVTAIRRIAVLRSLIAETIRVGTCRKWKKGNNKPVPC